MKKRYLWMILSLMLAPSLLWSQVVQAVSTRVESGQTLVQIEGKNLPRPTVRTWRNQFLILEFRARYEGRGREVSVSTPHAIKLRYGWFTNNPPRVRVVVTMRGKPKYRVEQAPNGWQVIFGEVDSTLPLEAKTTAPSEVASTQLTVSTTPKPQPSNETAQSPLQTALASTPPAPRTYTPAPSEEPPTEIRTLAVNPPARPTAPARITVSLDFVGAEIGDVLKALAIQSGANIVTAPDVKGTVTVSLNRVTVEEALDLITRLSGYRYENVNGVYVVGTPNSIEAFRASGKKEESASSERAVEVITFKVAKPNEVATYLTARFPNLKVTPVGDKDSAYLLVEGPSHLVEEARASAYAFEQQMAGGVEIVTEVYRVQFADSRDLARILNQMVPSVTVSLGPNPLLSQGAMSGTSGSGGAGSSDGDAPSPASQQMGAPMQGGLPTGGAQGEQPPNQLVLMGTARDVLRALEILRKVDVKQPQVLIEARVLDLSEGSLKSFGLSWNILQSGSVNTLDRSQGQLPLPGGSTITPNQQGVGVNRDGQLGIDFTIVKQPIDFSITLNALAEDRRNRLLANPRIATLDGRQARIFIGDEVNYVKLIQQTPQGANVQTDSVEAGIILTVLPRIHEDRSITLQIRPEVSVITGFLEVPGGGRLPQLARRNADTTIRLNNGETLIIGGLIREADIRTIQKVPLLGDLPFLGYLFRRTTNTRDRSEIVITLTVRVLE
ncbi:MAG: secretin and TonB N-terminal domain-containing protein [Fimbriimonadales bacterium]